MAVRREGWQAVEAGELTKTGAKPANKGRFAGRANRAPPCHQAAFRHLQPLILNVDVAASTGGEVSSHREPSYNICFFHSIQSSELWLGPCSSENHPPWMNWPPVKRRQLNEMRECHLDCGNHQADLHWAHERSTSEHYARLRWEAERVGIIDVVWITPGVI